MGKCLKPANFPSRKTEKCKVFKQHCYLKGLTKKHLKIEIIAYLWLIKDYDTILCGETSVFAALHRIKCT
jgi:hypothetical protein